jgi:hypothetical protein
VAKKSFDMFVVLPMAMMLATMRRRMAQKEVFMVNENDQTTPHIYIAQQDILSTKLLLTRE